MIRYLLLLLVFLGAASTAMAQDEDAPPRIAPDNAAQLHRGAVLAPGRTDHIGWSADGSRLLISATTGASVYDVTTGARIAYLPDAGRAVVSPDGATILVFDPWLRQVSAHNVGDGRLRYVLSGRAWPVAFSPDGRLFAVARDFTGEVSGVDVFDLAGGAPLAALDVPDAITITGVQFWPDGTALAVNTGVDRYLLRLDETGAPQLLASDPWYVGDVLLSDGTLLYARSPIDETVVYITRDGEVDPVAVLEGHSDAPYQAWFSPDGTVIATRSLGDDDTIRLWRVGDGQELARFPVGSTQVIEGPQRTLAGLIVQSDSVSHVIGLDGEVVAQLPAFDAERFIASLGPNRRWLSIAHAGAAWMWHLDDGERVDLLTTDEAARLSDEAPSAADLNVSVDEVTLTVRDAQGDVLAGFRHELETQILNTTAFRSPEGGLLVAAAAVGTSSVPPFGVLIRVWEVNEEGQAGLQQNFVLEGYINHIGGLQFSRAGDALAYLAVWQDSCLRGSAELQVLHIEAEDLWTLASGRSVVSPVYSPDGRLLAVGVNADSCTDQGGELVLYDAATGSELARYRHNSMLTQVAFVDDGAALHVETLDGAVLRWVVSGG